MKKHIFKLFLITFLSASTVFSCTNNPTPTPTPDPEPTPTPTPVVEKKIVLDQIADVEIHGDAYNDFLENPVDSNVPTYKAIENSRPNPVHLSWTDKEGSAGKEYTVKISESVLMNNPYTIYTTDTSYDLYNIKVNTRYFWTVSSGTEVSKVSTFISKQEYFRNIYIDGNPGTTAVTNCRDLGGHITEQGKQIRQGLIYRTGRFNQSETTDYELQISEKGIDTLKNQLGVKTEIDLRMDGDDCGHVPVTGNILGVTYKRYPMDYNKSNLITGNKESVKKLFNEVLSVPSMYPLAFHCNIGTDRTGSIAYTLLALCGVNKNTLIADYLLSNLGVIKANRYFSNIANSYPKMYDDAEGSSLMEKTANSLINELGITQETIDKIRSILIK